MKRILGIKPRGFTLIELLAALVILSLLALMSYRGLASVLDAREYVRQETEKWRRVTSFLARFERDVQLAAPRPVRAGSKSLPAWQGTVKAQPGEAPSPYLEFSRFGSTEGMDGARRIAYVHNHRQDIELWLWPSLDVATGTLPARYTVLAGVTKLEFQYLTASLVWVNAWPDATPDSPISMISSIPKAVRLRVVLGSGEDIERIFH